MSTSDDRLLRNLNTTIEETDKRILDVHNHGVHEHLLNQNYAETDTPYEEVQQSDNASDALLTHTFNSDLKNQVQIVPHRLTEKLELQFKSDPTLDGGNTVTSERTEIYLQNQGRSKNMSPEFHNEPELAPEETPLDSLRQSQSSISHRTYPDKMASYENIF